MADTWTKRQITGDPIVDARIAAMETAPPPLVEPKPYNLGAQIGAGWEATKDLVDRYTQNMTRNIS